MTDEIEYKGYTIKISQDDCQEESPRDWENLGVMICFHRGMKLGDDPRSREVTTKLFNEPYPIIDGEEYSMESLLSDHYALAAWLRTCKDVAVCLPIYAYEHSNITISAGRGYPFCDPWDSGQLGWIFATKNMLRKEYGVKHVTKSIIEKATRALEQEVKTYDQFLTGDVWGYQILSPDGDEMDGSCWGFYGQEYAIQEAKEMIDWYIAQDESAARISAAFDQE